MDRAPRPAGLEALGAIRVSEDQAAGLDDRPHSPATDPHATIAAGDVSGMAWHPAVPPPGGGGVMMTEAERAHNAQMFGVTYRERVTRDHNRCIILCLSPNPGRVNQCPSCYQKAIPMDIYAAGINPLPGRAQRIGRWMGEWAAAAWEAFTLPFRRDEEHARALITDILQDAIAELTVIQVCPACQDKGEQ